MDGIIWNSESLQLMASMLKGTSNEMELNVGILRRCRSEVPLALRDDGGTLLGDILEQLEHAIRKLSDTSERALELARAVQFIDTLFEETEREIRQLYENAAVFASAETGAPVASVRWEAGADVSIARGLADRTVAVPKWLSSAAEDFFRGVMT